jgi:hypothetical protein
VTERLIVDADDTEPLGRPAGVPSGVARVNLLPPEIARERRLQRIAATSVGLLIAYLCALGVIYVLKVGDVTDAREQRDRVTGEVAALQAELETLAKYRTLTDDINEREALLTAAMADELSWARVFGELALSFSDDASLTQAQATTAGSQEGAAPAPAPEPAEDDQQDEDAPVGQVTFTGYSVQRIAPGVEEMLQQLDEGDGFVDSYVLTTADEERGGEQITGFEARVDLNTEVHTHRYDDGLPQESIE